MISLGLYIQRKMIWPLAIFLGIVISTSVIICLTFFYNQEVNNRRLVLERVTESLKDPISLGSYIEIKSRLLSHNKKIPYYCLDFTSLNFNTNLCKNNIYYNLSNKIIVEFSPGQILILNYSWKPFIVKSISIVVSIITIFLIVGIIFFKRSNKIAEQLKNEVLMIYKNVEDYNFRINEFKDIKSQFSYFIKNQSKMLESDARAAMAKQVAHDIRSPLAALEVINDSISAFPENDRLIIRHAIQRINDIANELLQKGTSVDALKSELSHSKLTLELVPALVDVLVSEKRLQYREFSTLTIETDLQNSFGLFANINAGEIRRVLSNLINNAIESLNDYFGHVAIKVRKEDSFITISISDNGKGIPQNMIKNLGDLGFSYGKENLESSGSGLGFHHAKKVIESFKGKIEINSIEGNGTTIKLYLNNENAPGWFLTKLDLTNQKHVVSLDDDFSIHQIWKKRLNNEFSQIQFQSAIAFMKFVNEESKNYNNLVYLIDYELLNQFKNGLDLIEELRIENNSVLVTSRYDDKEIQKRALSLGVKIIPKSLAAFIPFETMEKENQVDLVLVDNDELVRLTWQSRVAKNKKKILCYSNVLDLKKDLAKLPKETIFYIDVHLSNNENGIDLSKELFELGFNELYLATGEDESSFSDLSWIKGIVGKAPPKNF